MMLSLMDFSYLKVLTRKLYISRNAMASAKFLLCIVKIKLRGAATQYLKI